MSGLSTARYHPWNRVVVSRQSVSAQGHLAVLDLGPDERFSPLCSRCRQRVSRTCSHEVRAVRDLNMASARSPCLPRRLLGRCGRFARDQGHALALEQVALGAVEGGEGVHRLCLRRLIQRKKRCHRLMGRRFQLSKG